MKKPYQCVQTTYIFTEPKIIIRPFTPENFGISYISHSTNVYEEGHIKGFKIFIVFNYMIKLRVIEKVKGTINFIPFETLVINIDKNDTYVICMKSPITCIPCSYFTRLIKGINPVDEQTFIFDSIP